MAKNNNNANSSYKAKDLFPYVETLGYDTKSVEEGIDKLLKIVEYHKTLNLSLQVENEKLQKQVKDLEKRNIELEYQFRSINLQPSEESIKDLEAEFSGMMGSTVNINTGGFNEEPIPRGGDDFPTPPSQPSGNSIFSRSHRDNKEDT